MMIEDDMVIEKGSDVTRRQVRGGPHNGAWGVLVGTMILPTGREEATVCLESGEFVTFTEVASAGPELPRELGS